MPPLQPGDTSPVPLFDSLRPLSAPLSGAEKPDAFLYMWAMLLGLRRVGEGRRGVPVLLEHVPVLKMKLEHIFTMSTATSLLVSCRSDPMFHSFQ